MAWARSLSPFRAPGARSLSRREGPLAQRREGEWDAQGDSKPLGRIAVVCRQIAANTLKALTRGGRHGVALCRPFVALCRPSVARRMARQVVMGLLLVAAPPSYAQ